MQHDKKNEKKVHHSKPKISTTSIAGKKLKSELDNLKYYLDSIPSPVHVVDNHFTVKYINKAASDILNMAPEECIGKKCYELFKTTHCRTPDCAVRKAIEHGEKFTAETVIDPSNINLPAQYTAVPLKDGAGNVIGALEHITDITSLKSAIENLQIQKSYLDSLPAPVHIVDKKYNVQYINKIGAEVFGLTPEDCIGSKCYELFKTPHCNTAECRMRKAISENKPATGENIADPGSINLPIQYTCIPVKNKKGEIVGGLEHITDITELKKAMNDIHLQNWIQSGQGKLSEEMRGDQDIETLSGKIISLLVKYLNGSVGTFYTLNAGTSVLELTGSYAFSCKNAENNSINLGDGVVGQVAESKELITLKNIPTGYLKLKSSVGESDTTEILIVPFLFEGDLLGVFEIASLNTFAEKEINFIKSVTENIGIAVNSAVQRVKLKQLLEETQAQSEELQAQQEELRASNEELEEKNKILQETEEKLKAQQEELEASYEELEEKTNEFERQKNKLY